MIFSNDVLEWRQPTRGSSRPSRVAHALLASICCFPYGMSTETDRQPHHWYDYPDNKARPTSKKLVHEAVPWSMEGYGHLVANLHLQCVSVSFPGSHCYHTCVQPWAWSVVTWRLPALCTQLHHWPVLWTMCYVPHCRQKARYPRHAFSSYRRLLLYLLHVSSLHDVMASFYPQYLGSRHDLCDTRNGTWDNISHIVPSNRQGYKSKAYWAASYCRKSFRNVWDVVCRSHRASYRAFTVQTLLWNPIWWL